MLFTIILWSLVLLFTILVIIVCLPVKLILTASTQPEFVVKVGLFRGFFPLIKVYDSKIRHQKKEEKVTSDHKAKDKKSGKSNRKKTVSIASMFKLFSELIAIFKIDDLLIQLEFGFPDPADTGHIYGQLTPFLYGMEFPNDWVIDARPDFGQARFLGVFNGSISFVPVMVFPPIFRFVWREYGSRS
jgi:hypothetical protein